MVPYYYSRVFQQSRCVLPINHIVRSLVRQERRTAKKGVVNHPLDGYKTSEPPFFWLVRKTVYIYLPGC